MRLLFLTNFYPCTSRGGYEQWCQEIAEGLRAKGYEVVVLTSRHGRDSLLHPDPAWIVRDLYLEMELASLRNSFQFFTQRKMRESSNLVRLRQVVNDFLPDIVLVWGMWNLPRSLPALAEELMSDRIAYYMGDYWPTLPDQFMIYWQQPARHWSSAFVKKFLGAIAIRTLANEKRPQLKFAHIIFPTVFLRDELEPQGVKLHSTAIIYGAVDTRPYLPINRSIHEPIDKGLTLMYVGRLSYDKGVHTAIQALGEIVHRCEYSNVSLTIVGTGEADYEAYLHKLARQCQVETRVQFLGAQPKDAMPELYQRADILLFTSIWPEPFGRVIVEAMASGVVVVGAASGGAAEILVENENALLFPPGDAMGLANQITRLVESPALRKQLAEAGRQTAQTRFDLQRMITEIEAYLLGMLN